MQASKILQMQSRVAERLLTELPRGWSAYKLHYENVTLKGEQLEKYISECQASGEPIDFSPSLDAIDLLVELQDEMAQSSSGRWAAVDCRLSPDGTFSFNFTYGIPPMAAQSLPYL